MGSLIKRLLGDLSQRIRYGDTVEKSFDNLTPFGQKAIVAVIRRILSTKFCSLHEQFRKGTDFYLRSKQTFFGAVKARSVWIFVHVTKSTLDIIQIVDLRCPPTVTTSRFKGDDSEKHRISVGVLKGNIIAWAAETTLRGALVSYHERFIHPQRGLVERGQLSDFRYTTISQSHVSTSSH
jgi:hypothetical protein